jgi:biopolymer transport protein ExbD
VAVKTDALHAGTLVRVENGAYFLGDREVSQVELAARLQEVRAGLGAGPDSESLVIQADREADFSALVPVIRAGSITGFNKFRFAVLQGDGSSEGRL